jgi:hypothetical protein
VSTVVACEQARSRAIAIIAAARSGEDPAAERDAGRSAITVILAGKRLSDLQPFWPRESTRAGLKNACIHDLRQTFASTAVASGQGLPIRCVVAAAGPGLATA